MLPGHRLRMSSRIASGEQDSSAAAGEPGDEVRHQLGDVLDVVAQRRHDDRAREVLQQVDRVVGAAEARGPDGGDQPGPVRFGGLAVGLQRVGQVLASVCRTVGRGGRTRGCRSRSPAPRRHRRPSRGRSRRRRGSAGGRPGCAAGGWRARSWSCRCPTRPAAPATRGCGSAGRRPDNTSPRAVHCRPRRAARVTGGGAEGRGLRAISGAASCTCRTPPAVPRSTQLGRTCTRATTPEGRSSSSTRRSELIASIAPAINVPWSAGSISSRARSLLITRSGLTASTAPLLRLHAVR